jgi:soluble lytic murein transglycosylase
MQRRRPLLRLVTMLGMLALAAIAHAQATDADVLAAKAAFERGDRARLDAIVPRTAGHVLEAYVLAWQLRLMPLEAASFETVQSYLQRFGSTQAGERLRSDWVKVLAKRGDWPHYAQIGGMTSRDDAELACYALQYRWQQEGDAALATAKPLWFNGQATPEACDPLFASLIARGELTVADRWTRYRLALEAGNVRLAQTIAGDLPMADRLDARELQKVDTQPLRALMQGNFRLKQRDGREMALYALERAARGDATTARVAWVKLREQLPAPDRAWGDGRLAYHAARQMQPLANEWYREADPTMLNAEQHAWRVRAALRAQSWRDVLAAIESMPPEQADESAWRYWRARALVVAGRKDEAQKLYEPLAGEYSFYGILAAEALGRRVEPPSTTVAVNGPWQSAFAVREDVRRAVRLASLDLRAESQREWLNVVRGLDDELLLQAADYARRVGMHDRSINTADRTVAMHDFSLRYPIPFRNEFSAAAREHAVDVELLLGIARQESRFNPDIVSSAGAVGLMQLMPGTAKLVARQLGRADFRPDRIASIDTNTAFGAYYFKYWLDRLERLPALAAAAYNAGPGRAQAWRPAAPLEGAIWVETIPFNETRDYVRKVLANTMLYARALGRPAVSLTDRLGVVPPRPAQEALASSPAAP